MLDADNSLSPQLRSSGPEGLTPGRSTLAHPALSLVVPTYNERSNMRALVDSVREALGDLPWEMIVVDDDSPDRTYEEVAAIAREEPRVRCLRRIGRRGLSSAVIEGSLVANADIVAVMDADFQHDETMLRPMYDKLQGSSADLVVGTRYANGGGVGDWNSARQRMSAFANWMSQILVAHQTTDPVSGFFMVRRSVLASSIYDLSQQGYKILIDIITSSPRPLSIVEVPYVFRSRRSGDSKISVTVLAEFLFLIIDKISRGWIPPRFVLFAIVGGFGLVVHLSLLYLLKGFGVAFLPAQSIAIAGAMVFNFTINNEFTYRDRRLKGAQFVTGFLMFAAICSLGAVANVGVANLAIQSTNRWSVAGIAGALISAVFNFGAASKLVWERRRTTAAASGAGT